MTTSDEHPLEIATAQAWPLPGWVDTYVVLAVSGGPDRVALVRAVLALKRRNGGRGQVIVAHFHHGLRGAKADQDQAWIGQLCRRWKIRLEVERADVTGTAAARGDGWEAAARHSRYEFFRQIAELAGARWVALGHTTDDQTETVLHRILRGTGLAGLAGMPPRRPLSPSVALVRPLLDVSRGE